MIGFGREAVLDYGDSHFDIMQPGDYVRCAVSGEKIALSALRYWSVDLQEAYANAEISLARKPVIDKHNAEAD